MAFRGLELLSYPSYWSRDSECLLIKDKEMEKMKIEPVRLPIATTYDVDDDYDYIMAKAIKSYKLHREREQAAAKMRDFRPGSGGMRRYLRPKTAPPNSRSMKIAKLRPVYVPRVDAINEVKMANETEERPSRKVLQVTRVNLRMNEESPKTKSFLKRNQPSFSWYSNSYPTTSQIQQFAGPPSQNQMSTSCILDGASSSVASTAAGRNVIRSERPLTAKSKSDEGASSYNYEGGLFFEPKKHSDFFVIHPDWVSEAMSIQKLTLSSRNVTKTLTWPGRRCKSAPPPKLRNPITWDQRV